MILIERDVEIAPSRALNAPNLAKRFERSHGIHLVAEPHKRGSGGNVWREVVIEPTEAGHMWRLVKRNHTERSKDFGQGKQREHVADSTDYKDIGQALGVALKWLGKKLKRVWVREEVTRRPLTLLASLGEPHKVDRLTNAIRRMQDRIDPPDRKKHPTKYNQRQRHLNHSRVPTAQRKKRPGEEDSGYHRKAPEKRLGMRLRKR